MAPLTAQHHEDGRPKEPLNSESHMAFYKNTNTTTNKRGARCSRLAIY
jgi:hypothetical protein